MSLSLRFKHFNTECSVSVPDPPVCDGGAAVSHYSVEMAQVEGDSQQEVFQGSDLFCTVHQLLPGTAYLFWVKAYNAAGVGSYERAVCLKLYIAVMVSGPHTAVYTV